MRRTLLLLALTSCTVAQADLVLPPRPPTALTGSQLLPYLRPLSWADRDALLWHEFASGNVPVHLRTLVPVTTQAPIGGRTRRATFWCTPDYLGIGTDADWFRMPMAPPLAQQIADRLDCVLPTRKMVDAIWAQAPAKLTPYPFSPSVYNIVSVDVFYQSHLHIESQRTHPQGTLVAGIKKDVVASALIASWPSRVVIYGWHYPNGTPIQPLSKAHTFPHVDYSHGIRLVARQCEVDGLATTVDAVLADPAFYVLLSDEGPVTSWRYPASTTESLPLRDAFPPIGPELTGWRAKFTQPRITPVSPIPPSGDAVALTVMDPAGGTDSIRTEAGLVRDVIVQATLLCEHRPGLAADGFERIGVFTRDQADGAFDGTLSQHGACYALTWDSADGRVRCLRAAGGQNTDLLPSPRFLPGTAWRRFRIDARADLITFHLDGERVLSVVDRTYPSGSFGTGHHEYFATNPNAHGARVDSFWADVPDAFEFDLRSAARCTLELRRRRGVPRDLYLTVLTLTPGTYPHGAFYGLDPTPGDLSVALGSSDPLFLGVLDDAGRAVVTVPGVPPGLSLYGVSFDIDPSVRFWQPSRPDHVVVR